MRRANAQVHPPPLARTIPIPARPPGLPSTCLGGFRLYAVELWGGEGRFERLGGGRGSVACRGARERPPACPQALEILLSPSPSLRWHLFKSPPHAHFLTRGEGGDSRLFRHHCGVRVEWIAAVSALARAGIAPFSPLFVRPLVTHARGESSLIRAPLASQPFHTDISSPIACPRGMECARGLLCKGGRRKTPEKGHRSAPRGQKWPQREAGGRHARSRMGERAAGGTPANPHRTPPLPSLPVFPAFLPSRSSWRRSPLQKPRTQTPYRRRRRLDAEGDERGAARQGGDGRHLAQRAGSAVGGLNRQRPPEEARGSVLRTRGGATGTASLAPTQAAWEECSRSHALQGKLYPWATRTAREGALLLQVGATDS